MLVWLFGAWWTGTPTLRVVERLARGREGRPGRQVSIGERGAALQCCSGGQPYHTWWTVQSVQSVRSNTLASVPVPEAPLGPSPTTIPLLPCLVLHIPLIGAFPAPALDLIRHLHSCKRWLQVSTLLPCPNRRMPTTNLLFPQEEPTHSP